MCAINTATITGGTDILFESDQRRANAQNPAKIAQMKNKAWIGAITTVGSENTYVTDPPPDQEPAFTALPEARPQPVWTSQ